MRKELLDKPLSEIDFTEHLQEAVQNSGFNTLAELLECDADTLVKEKKFSLHAITELVTFLQKHGLENLLRD